MSNEKPIFIVDAMLGKLAKKLRLLGYDTAYSSDIEDEDLIRMTKNENRILITKDVQLARKAEKKQLKAIQITKSDEVEQFLQINEKIKLGKYEIKGKNSRCPVCNGELENIEKNMILDKVPKGVLEYNQDFWMCKNCKKIYWEGTHIRNLQKFMEKLNDRL